MGVLDRRAVLDIMHGRNRMTLDLRILTMPGRSKVGFPSTRQTFLGGGRG